MAEIRRLAAVCKAHLAAASRYRPQPYGGRAVLFQARESGGGRWTGGGRPLCPRLCVERVPGDHYSMLRKPHVDVLAERLDQHLAEAAEGQWRTEASVT